MRVKEVMRMREEVEVLIIGAGISGLATAYSLQKRGVKDILILDKSYIGAGSTGRCATGIRASFTSKEHVVLMKHGIELWKKYAAGELGQAGLYYDQSGYVWVATRDESAEFFEKLVKLHNSLGVNTRIIGIDELKELVPPMRVEGVAGAMLDPTAGKSYPFDTVFAFLKLVKERGAEVVTRVKVTKILASSGKVTGVEVEGGKTIKASTVVVAAGSGSRELLGSVGVKLPIENIPRHALITEPYKEAFKPLVIDWDTSGVPYIVQSKEGGFFMGRDVEERPELPLTSQRIDFMPKAVKPLAKFFPWLRNIRVLRYWIGYYVTTPDHHPIYGPVNEVEGLYVATGYSGHGYMMGPITGELLAEWILNGKPHIPEARNLTLDRFERGALIKELAVVG